jgi:hypothetical protein
MHSVKCRREDSNLHSRNGNSLLNVAWLLGGMPWHSLDKHRILSAELVSNERVSVTSTPLDETRYGN